MAIHISCSGKRKDNFLKRMLQCGADIKAPPVNFTNHVGIMLEYGAEMFIWDGKGQMPIHMHCQ